MRRPEQILVQQLRQKNILLALAESVTCGLAAYSLGTVTGASEVLSCSLVCYTEAAKEKVLHIPQKLIRRYTAESRQATEAMARKLAEVAPEGIYAGITGLASPGGSETAAKPVGTIFVSVYYKRKMYSARRRFRGSPSRIKKEACNYLFRELAKRIK